MPEEKEKLTKRYLGFIANRHKAIPCLDEDVSLTMENYIPLQLGEERKEERPKTRREEELKETKDIDLRVWREEHSIGQIHSLTPVDIWRAIQNKKIVLKGDPGAGKTTLTHYIAYSLCNRRDRACPCPKERTTARVVPTDLIPLTVNLRDWAGKGAIPFLEYYAKYALMNSGFEDEIGPLIRNWLKSGKCIILCDGLDEVTSNKEPVIQSLQNLTSGEYRNCHILVTTRIVGYANELSGWKHYEVIPLKKENIEQYAKDYLKDKSSSFLSALKKTPQMEPLSKNPLLLQILCFVFDKQRLVLPTRRVELYEKAVHEMLERRNPEIPSSVKEKVLQQIAFSFLEQGKEVSEEWDLRETTKGFLFKAKEKYDADKVLKEIVEGSGLLCRFGDGRYMFLHLTFEEYLCACYLTKSEEDPCRILEPVLFNPRFREVARLTAGVLPKEEASRFINFILNQKPLCYDVLHQPLLLTGMCIADIPDDKANPSLEREILGKLLKLWKETEFSPLREEINRVFTAMAGTRRNGEEIINNLLGLLKEIINNLLGRLKDKYLDVRRDAVKALGDLGRADDRVIDTLFGLLKDEDSWVRGNAAKALGDLGRADDRVIDLLLGLLKDEYADVRRDAAKALGNLGRADDRVIDRLLGLFEDEDWDVRRDAAEVSGNIGRADDRVIDGLLGRLEDEDSEVRSNAAKALGNLDRADDRVIDGLLGLLKDEDWGVRGNAAEALGNLGRADDRVIDRLLGLLKDEALKDVAYSALQKLAENQARERPAQPPVSLEVEPTPDGFKSFVEANRIRAETLISNMDFSQEIIAKAKSELPETLSKFKGISVILCGSFCRLEASRSSDADFFAIFENEELADKAIEAMMLVAEWFDKQEIDVHLKGLRKKLQEDCQEGFGKGRFPTLFPKDELLGKLGSKEESDEWRTRRMCLLTESLPLYNPQFFNEVKEALLKEYLSHLASKMNRLEEIILNEFRMWCLSLDIAPWIRKEVSDLFEIKANILRRFMHNSTIIAFGASLARGTEEAYERQLSILDIPPILRLLHTLISLPVGVKDEAVKIAKEVIECYNDSLKALSDEDLRRYLEEGLPDKEAKYIKQRLDENGTRLKDNFTKLWELVFQSLTLKEKGDFLL